MATAAGEARMAGRRGQGPISSGLGARPRLAGYLTFPGTSPPRPGWKDNTPQTSSRRPPEGWPRSSSPPCKPGQEDVRSGRGTGSLLASAAALPQRHILGGRICTSASLGSLLASSSRFFQTLKASCQKLQKYQNPNNAVMLGNFPAIRNTQESNPAVCMPRLLASLPSTSWDTGMTPARDLPGLPSSAHPQERFAVPKKKPVTCHFPH